MANEPYLLIFGIVILIFVVVVAVYLLYGKQIETRNRLKLIRAYKAEPHRTGGAPVLVHGPAGTSGVAMPAGGEPVAFHATFIMSNGCTVIMGTSALNRPLPTNASFKVFVTSGDFTVTEAGVPYRISIVSVLERMHAGANLFTSRFRTSAVLDGVPEMVFDDMVRFIAGSQALEPVFGISETGRSVSSTIDTRVRTFVQGQNVPHGIADILRGRIIRPKPGEEITVVELYIPLKKSVWVFGEFDGRDTVKYGEGGAGLYISCTDPETEGAR